MSTRTQTQQALQLCDYCGQKSKFGTYQYCSKTCATQAATLCKYCHKKQKHGTFDYCGKTCAGLAGTKTQSGTGGILPPQSAPPPKSKGPSIKGTSLPGPSQKQSQPKAPQIPVVLAQLAQHLPPQAQVLLNSVVNNSAPTSQPPTTQASRVPVNNPFISLATNSTPLSSNAGAPLNSTAHHGSPAVLECIIPGCGQPVHIDSNGYQSSDYCSMRHREEAVTSGLAQPCIMCLTLPQSGNSYFCGKACRDEAMSKPLD